MTADGKTRVLEILPMLKRSFVDGAGGLLFVKYVLSCTFFSSIWSLLDPVQNIYRVIAKFQGAKHATWEFARGYWYAWTLSILFLMLSVGPIVPSLWPVGAIFFFLRYLVDMHNIRSGRYEFGVVDVDGTLGATAVRRIKQGVAKVWMIAGFICVAEIPAYLGFEGHSSLFTYVGGVLLCLGVVLFCK